MSLSYCLTINPSDLIAVNVLIQRHGWLPQQSANGAFLEVPGLTLYRTVPGPVRDSLDHVLLDIDQVAGPLQPKGDPCLLENNQAVEPLLPTYEAVLVLLAINRALNTSSLQFFDDANNSSLEVGPDTTWTTALIHCGLAVNESARELAVQYGLAFDPKRLFHSEIPVMNW